MKLKQAILASIFDVNRRRAVRSRVLFRSDRGHYRRREALDPQRQQRGRQASEAARHKRNGVISAEAAHRARRETRRARRRSDGRRRSRRYTGVSRPASRPGESTLNRRPRKGDQEATALRSTHNQKDMSDQNDDN